MASSSDDLSKHLNDYWTSLWWKQRVCFLLKEGSIKEAQSLYNEFDVG
tara:strand:- start:1396 stop:1539 length:144 start_codon:yes stop_codon:yes gene_type:complete